MSARADSPGVAYPPPFLFAAAVLAGFLLERRWPLPMSPGVIGRLAAWTLVALSVPLTYGSISLFWRRHTSIIPNRPAGTLVVAGPYRFTRNPMYLGLTLLTVALAIFMSTWWPLVLLVPALAVLQVTVIRLEEAYLRRRFGTDYDAYARRVRRWF
jgi:protein-S-isoprenylcysteine O-methyltransferase Ste14